jgi:hypothetical protein
MNSSFNHNNWGLQVGESFFIVFYWDTSKNKIGLDLKVSICFPSPNLCGIILYYPSDPANLVMDAALDSVNFYTTKGYIHIRRKNRCIISHSIMHNQILNIGDIQKNWPSYG